MADDNTQLICGSEPVCLCTGENSCDCTPDERGQECTGCEARMHRIDVESGEDVRRGT